MYPATCVLDHEMSAELKMEESSSKLQSIIFKTLCLEAVSSKLITRHVIEDLLRYTKFMWMHVPVIVLESVQQESY